MRRLAIFLVLFEQLEDVMHSKDAMKIVKNELRESHRRVLSASGGGVRQCMVTRVGAHI